MSVVRVILVGLGARARIWRRVVAARPDCRIVGLVDQRVDAVMAAVAETAGAVGGATLAEVTARVAADAVILSTPPGGRDDQIAAACAAGLAILAEKPLADSVEAAEAHVATAARAGVSLAVGLNFRYLAVTRALKALLTPEQMGRPEFAHFTYERWRDGRLPHLNKYPLTMDHPMLWEQSIHHFDLMRFVYDAEPTTISARTFNPSWSMYRGDANVSALIIFTGGLEVTYQGTWAGNWQPMTFNWRTETPHGVVIQADMFGALGYARRDDAALTPVTLPAVEPWVDDAAALFDDFAAHVRDGAPLPCPGTDHVRSLRMVAACIESSMTGRAVDPRVPGLQRTSPS
ncbi:MAG: oxidoreductase [Acidobacterium sp.]|nr:Gfo/Idh/MocA family oxidoreductase [Acidobacteriota bacterium]PHY11704.1 MAG: oxidoreductase [Acidobacterium sp.]